MSTVMSTVTSTPMSPGSAPTNPIPRLRRGVSLIVGMDNQPMLFDSDSGKYHRLGAAAAFIVNQFDGVRSLPTIIEELPQDIDEAGAKRITSLVDNLRDKSLLVGSEPAPAVPAAPARTRRTRGRHTAQPRQARHLKVERPRRSGGGLRRFCRISRSACAAPMSFTFWSLPGLWMWFASCINDRMPGGIFRCVPWVYSDLPTARHHPTPHTNCHDNKDNLRCIIRIVSDSGGLIPCRPASALEGASAARRVARHRKESSCRPPPNFPPSFWAMAAP